MYSAPAIAISSEFAVRFKVAPTKSASRPHQRRGRSQEELRVGNVLDHFERQHGVEPLDASRDRFGGGDAVVDRQSGRRGVGAGRSDRRLAGVDPGYGKAEASHRFGDQPAAATDIDEAEPGEGLQQRGRAAEVIEKT